MTMRLEFDGVEHILEPEYDSLALSFPFRIVTPGDGAWADTTSQRYSVVVEASDHIPLEWGSDFREDPFGPAPAFFEYARPEAIRRVVEDDLSNTERFRIRRPQNAEVMPPIDPAKLKEPSGHSETINLENERMRLREMRGEGRIVFSNPS